MAVKRRIQGPIAYSTTPIISNIHVSSHAVEVLDSSPENFIPWSFAVTQATLCYLFFLKKSGKQSIGSSLLYSTEGNSLRPESKAIIEKIYHVASRRASYTDVVIPHVQNNRRKVAVKQWGSQSGKM